jgi:hypothetical protein
MSVTRLPKLGNPRGLIALPPFRPNQTAILSVFWKAEAAVRRPSADRGVPL